jgi:HlyD family secretion protein
MATTTLQRDQGIKRGRWLAGGVALIVIVIVAALVLNSMSSRATTPTVATTTMSHGPIVATVAGSGTVAAAQSLDLSFQANGTVTEVLVQAGDQVLAGQVLAKIDDRDLQLQVASAQTSLQSAQAKLAQAQQGNATPEEIAATQASVANAEAQFDKARTGNITAADIASAEAALRAAQAQLDALKNPSPANLSTAQFKVTQAQNTLDSTRTSASATKTNAELAMYQAADTLTKVQSQYATAYENWQYVQNTGNDPINPSSTGADGKTKANAVSDGERQQYYDAYVQAEAALRSAEKAVTQAQVAYEKARQDEITQIQQAEAALADAQQQLAALQHPSANDLKQTQASVDQAKANLQKLTQGGTKADIAAAQANVDQARANLQKLTAPATETDLSIQQASVTQAEQALKQAQLKLEQATLKAPFAAVITAVNVVPGSSASQSASAVSLVDRSTLHVDLKLSENDVAKAQLGQKVTLTIDALKGWTAAGRVSYIAPAAETNNGVVTYAVRVSFPGNDARVKVGMSANLTITTDQKDNVLLVPNSALLPKGAGRAVQVLDADGTTREVEVQTGLTDGTNTEIISGLNAGDQVVTTPSTTTPPSGGGLFGG